MVFFCFFPSSLCSPRTHEQSYAVGKLARELDSAAVRDDDAGLGGTRRRTEPLDLLDDVEALNNLACDRASTSQTAELT